MAKIKDPNRWEWLSNFINEMIVWGTYFGIITSIIFFLWNVVLVKTGLFILPLSLVESFLLSLLIGSIYQLWKRK